MPNKGTVVLQRVGACLQVDLDTHSGKVTATVVDPRDGQLVALRADPLTLYAPFEAGSSRAIEAARTWLYPADAAPDSNAILRATRFEGENRALRGAGSLHCMLTLIVVRGVPFWGVELQLGRSDDRVGSESARPLEPHPAD